MSLRLLLACSNFGSKSYCFLLWNIRIWALRLFLWAFFWFVPLRALSLCDIAFSVVDSVPIWSVSSNCCHDASRTEFYSSGWVYQNSCSCSYNHWHLSVCSCVVVCFSKLSWLNFFLYCCVFSSLLFPWTRCFLMLSDIFVILLMQASFISLLERNVYCVIRFPFLFIFMLFGISWMNEFSMFLFLLFVSRFGTAPFVFPVAFHFLLFRFLAVVSSHCCFSLLWCFCWLGWKNLC